MDDDVRAWQGELDRFEDTLDAAAALLSPAGADPDVVEQCLRTPAWTPPTHLGPLPAEVVPRAQALLERQRETASRVATAMRANSRQRGFAQRVSQATVTQARPAYLDVEA